MDLHRLRVLNFSDVSNEANKMFPNNNEEKSVQSAKKEIKDNTNQKTEAILGKGGKRSGIALPNTSKSMNLMHSVNKAGPVYKIGPQNKSQKVKIALSGNKIKIVDKTIKSNSIDLNDIFIQKTIDAHKTDKRKRRRQKRHTELEVLFSGETSNLINTIHKENLTNLKMRKDSTFSNKYLFSSDSQLKNSRKCKGKSLHASAKRCFFLCNPLKFIRSRRSSKVKSAPNCVYTTGTDNPFYSCKESKSIKNIKAIKRETRKEEKSQEDGSIQKPSLPLSFVMKKPTNDHNKVCKPPKLRKHTQRRKGRRCWSCLSYFRNPKKRVMCGNRKRKHIIIIGDDCRCESATVSCDPSLLKSKKIDYCIDRHDSCRHVTKHRDILSVDPKKKFLENTTSDPRILKKKRSINEEDKRCEELEYQNIKRNTLESTKIPNSLKRGIAKFDSCKCQNPSFSECPQRPRNLKQRKRVTKCISVLFLILLSPFLLIRRLWVALRGKNKINIPTSHKQKVKLRSRPNKKFENCSTQTKLKDSRITKFKKDSKLVKNPVRCECNKRRVKNKGTQSSNRQSYHGCRCKKLVSCFRQFINMINPCRCLRTSKRRHQRTAKNEHCKIVTNASTSISNNLLKPNTAPITPPFCTSTPLPVRHRRTEPDPKNNYKLFFRNDRGWLMKRLYSKHKRCKYCGALNLFQKTCNTTNKTPKEPHILKHNSYNKHVQTARVKCKCPEKSIFHRIFIRFCKNPMLRMTRIVQDVEAQLDCADPCQNLYYSSLRRKRNGFIYNNDHCLYTLSLTMREICESLKSFCRWYLCVCIWSPCLLIGYFSFLIIRCILCMF